MPLVLGTRSETARSQNGTASRGHAKPARKTEGSEVKRSTCMAVSRRVKRALRASARKMQASRKGRAKSARSRPRLRSGKP
jgi:hypothetical protein